MAVRRKRGPSASRPRSSARLEPDVAPRLLFLVRHATCGDTGFMGATDLPLTPEGCRQAARLTGLLAATGAARCFCSPMQRCRQTAAVALAETRLQPEVDRDLREINFGRWEGMRFDDIARVDPAGVRRFARFEADFAFPGGESVAGFMRRVRRAVGRMTACAEQPVLAFTHGGVITAAICHLLGLRPRQYVLFGIRHASLTALQVFGDRGVLVGLNQSGEVRT